MLSSSTTVPPKPHRRRCRAPEIPALHPPAQLISPKPRSAGHQTPPAAASRFPVAPCLEECRAERDVPTTGTKVEQPQVHAAGRVHIPASTEDASVGVHMSPERSCGLCSGRSPCPAAGLQEVCGQWETGWWQCWIFFFFLNRTPGEKHREKGMHKPAAHTRCTPNASQAALHCSRVHIAVPFRCRCCRLRSWWHRCCPCHGQ